MALTRDQKVAQVKDLAEKMGSASSIIFAHYIGLSVANITKLRSELQKGKAELKVAKKSLIQIAAKEVNAPDLTDEFLPGPVACIFSYEEPTAGANLAHKFASVHPQVSLIGGIFSGKLLSEAEAKEMATIPSRLQLLAIFMSMCNAPLTQFMSASSSPLTGFARALSEIAKKKESESPVSAPVATEAATATPAPTAEAAPAQSPAEPPSAPTLPA